ncbi:MAG: 1-acyl-sn-glycerol-3-phosphate acyltransferase [Akkermansiaceae bacterium]
MEKEGSPEQFADVRRHVGFLERREGLADLLERLLGYPAVRDAFVNGDGEEDLFDAVARRLGLTVEVSGDETVIPRTGPVVYVANHGHGGADALALMGMMCRHRDDVRVLANREVMHLRGVGPYVFPVAVMTESSANENTGSLRGMLKHLRQGGCLGVFPAGRVAYWQGDRMADPPWNNHVVKLLQRLEATIVPVWFHGNPPAAINLLSKLSPFLRTALIPTGLAWMRGRTVSARIGEPFPSGDLRAQGEEGVDWLRARLQSLQEKGN